MKITLYTISDCQFSVQEKEYLKSKNLPFDEKNLESNRDFLTEMLAVSNNFAGTPVTKIEKDDGQIVVLKGFTKEEFDKALGTIPSADSVNSVPPVVTMQTPDISAPTMPINAPVGAPMAPGASAMEPSPVIPPISPVSPSLSPAVDMNAPVQPTTVALNDTLNKLSSAMGSMPTPEPTAPVVQPAQDMSMNSAMPAVTNEPTTIDNPALNSILSNLEQKVGASDGAQSTNPPVQKPQQTVPATPGIVPPPTNTTV